MASCSKDIAPVPSPDPDAWMYDETLPVPIRFGVGELPATKGAINSLAEMQGKDFGFFYTHSGNDDWRQNTEEARGMKMPQNAHATCLVIPDGDDNPDNDKVQFKFTDGTYYYPSTSDNNYTFYGYYARIDQKYERYAKDSIFVLATVGYDDILWAKAVADKVTDAEGKEYYGYNARYLRKGGAQPLMNFTHSTARLSLSAKTKQSMYAGENPDSDVIKIKSLKVENAVSSAVLRIALKDGVTADAKGKPIDQKEWEGSLRPSSRKSLDAKNLSTDFLTTTSVELCDDFFLYPEGEGKSISITVTYEVYAKSTDAAPVQEFTATYDLLPEVKAGDKVGTKGFYAGYWYKYNFIVYTPERVGIEATVEPYQSAFGDGVTEDIYPDNE